MQIHLSILHGSPEAFDKNIVSTRSPAIHAEPTSPAFHCFDKQKCSKLTVLIGVDELRDAVPHKCLLENIHRMTRFQGNRSLGSQLYFDFILSLI